MQPNLHDSVVAHPLSQVGDREACFMNDSGPCVAGRRIPQDEVKTNEQTVLCLHQPQPGCIQSTRICLTTFPEKLRVLSPVDVGYSAMC